MWWSTKPIDMFCGAPFRLNAFITYTRFRDIMAAIRYTNKDVPILFTDKFHEVRQMIDAFNNHYTNEYTPSWLNCIDESMSSWLNKFCPGFMCVPRKPHPQGNEYHSIADADKDGTKPVMWRVKIVEGKDRPKRADGTYAFASQFEKKGYPPLEEIWAAKWWPNQQFTFLLSVAEANAVQVRARARKENAEPSLDFRKQLAKCMLTNKIGDNGVVVPSPIVARLRRNTERDRKRKGVNEGKWNPSKRCFNTVKTEYLREKCTDCSQTTREYCSCNPGRPLCRGCFALHAEQHGH